MKVFEIAKRMLNTDTSINYIAEMTCLYKEKIISLKIKQVGNIVSISIKNGYKGKIQMENNLPLSKKEDNIHHGFGMKSIKMVCEKYNGNLRLNIENNIFIVTILFIKKRRDYIIYDLYDSLKYRI